MGLFLDREKGTFYDKYVCHRKKRTKPISLPFLLYLNSTHLYVFRSEHSKEGVHIQKYQALFNMHPNFLQLWLNLFEKSHFQVLLLVGKGRQHWNEFYQLYELFQTRMFVIKLPTLLT